MQVKKIQDFRKARGQRYRLHNLLAIFILAIISGADDFEAVAEFAKSRGDFLKRHQLIENDRFPSHDLFRWILQMIDKQSFSKLLSTWLQTAAEQIVLKEATVAIPTHKMIHIDGKSLRASRSGNQHSRSALQIVSAYCSTNSICLGQLLIDKKSCEKTAIPKLLELLDLQDTLTTIDAMATHPKNAAAIIGKGGDYLLALKKNNKHFYEEVVSFFEHFQHTALITDQIETYDQAHGRKEIRRCMIISNLEYFPDAENWEELTSLICIESQRTIRDKTSHEKRFYLSSLPPKAKALAEAVRKHWTVENELHWSLDVSFNEDRCRIKDKQAAANFAAARRFALGLLKNANISKHSIKTQRLQAAWDTKFLDHLFDFFNDLSY